MLDRVVAFNDTEGSQDVAALVLGADVVLVVFCVVSDVVEVVVVLIMPTLT